MFELLCISTSECMVEHSFAWSKMIKNALILSKITYKYFFLYWSNQTLLLERIQNIHFYVLPPRGFNPRSLGTEWISQPPTDKIDHNVNGRSMPSGTIDPASESHCLLMSSHELSTSENFHLQSQKYIAFIQTQHKVVEFYYLIIFISFT